LVFAAETEGEVVELVRNSGKTGFVPHNVHLDTAVDGVKELFNFPDAALDLPLVVMTTHGAGFELDPDLISSVEILGDVHPTYLHLLACLQELAPLVQEQLLGWQNLVANLV
jgi:hypothetical protein